MQQIWDLIHFGYPDDIFPGHPKFAERFQNLCRAFAHFYQEYSTQPLWVVPINEISFLAWHAGEAKGTVPFATNNGWEIKYHLCQAAILGIEILKEEIPDCRVILVEPLIAIHDSETSDSQQVFEANEHQFQAMDMIAGRLCPELNGKEEYLDILGLNYYWNCQWQFGGETLVWPELEPRRIPLRHLLTKVYQRYQKPIFLSETGHIGVGRAQWLKEVATECRALQTQGVPFYGICLYPVVDRPNWDNLHEYHDCGIFDVDLNLNRQPHFELISSIKKIQAAITTSLGQRHPPLTALTGIKRELTPQD
ncbi:hypothetical protein [Oceanisphaera avium]|uniref:hypothetical protein n=1 Tax=Oceanisphaera avium TaxID=1903694 RepID=UPI0018E038F5|nr:hypothetical protein [Oceanisphaera avium]